MCCNDRIRGTAEVKPPTIRQVSIPTTLSAGEFSAIAGVTNEATRVKEMFRHPLTAAELNRFEAVVFDPPRAGENAGADGARPR